jgi:hypothetical protein
MTVPLKLYGVLSSFSLSSGLLNARLYLSVAVENWTARSCFSAAARVPNVPKFRRLPVRRPILREYNLYSPDLSLQIIETSFGAIKLGLGTVLKMDMSASCPHASHGEYRQESSDCQATRRVICTK